MEPRLLHPTGSGGRETARRVADSLAAALGRPVALEPLSPAALPAARRGETPAGAWCLLPGVEILRLPPIPANRAILLPRRDPSFGLRDLLRRPLDRIPPGNMVLVHSGLGEALLRRARPDLLPVRAGTAPVPDETPELVEGPFEAGGAGALDPATFLPAPGTGVDILVAPAGEEVPEAARGLEDATTRIAWSIERAFAEGAGALEPGASLGALARRKVSVLFQIRAVLFLPGAPARELRADIPLADARTFARAFGSHLLTSTNEIRKGA